MRRFDGRDPVAQRLVDGVLQRATAGDRGTYFGSEQPHAEYVERLSLHVDLAHVDDTLHAQQRGGGGGGDTVLPSARLRHESRLAHAAGKEGLAEDVVDLV